MTTGKRKTVEEQMYGMKEAIRVGDLDGKLDKKSAPKCLTDDHRALASGFRCPVCGFVKI